MLASGIACYLEEDYPEILKISVDRKRMNPTWKEWKKEMLKTKKSLENQGLVIQEILIRPQELLYFCQKEGIPVHGGSRATLASLKTQNPPGKPSRLF